MGTVQASFQAASNPFGFFPDEQRLDPDAVGKFMPVCEQTLKVQGFRSLL